MHSQEINNFSALKARSKEQLEKQLPFVLYRKPKEKKVVGLFQKTEQIVAPKDYKEQGFLFAPFDKEGASFVLIPNENIAADFVSKIDFPTSSKQVDEVGRKAHIRLVQKAIDEIAIKKLQKVIVSRKIEVRTTKSSIEIFETALQRYPNTFCYLWYHPNTGIWIGATPEVFLKAKNTNITTVALAGTIKAEDSKEPIWSTKEIEEQQIVVDYINDSFKESLKNVRVSKNQTVKAGAVYHLKSTITGKINENFKLKPLIEKLHPTPAVCGLPKTEALQFIHTNENYDRSYYTGFLGELNAGDASQTHLFVNLRCMKLEGNTASIFVGGGITKDSVPESEWLETQYKSQTMLSLL